MLLKRIKVPNKSEELAEFVGIVLGDGHIEHDKMVRIVGNSKSDYEYITIHVANLSMNLFGIEPRFHLHKTFNAIYLSLSSKELVLYLSEIGLKSGNKTINQVTMPDWICNNGCFLKACIRGLYDTDGSVYELLPHWPGLFQICFTAKNIKLLNQVREALLSFGYNVSQISNIGKENTTPRIYITRKECVRKFYSDIGFKNPKHNKKIAHLAPSSSGQG